MLRKGCLIALLAFAVLIAIPIVAAQYLPGWAVLLVIAVEVVSLRFLIPRLITYGIGRFAKPMIRTKSQVLCGARVHVHRVELTSAPDNAEAQPLFGEPQTIESSSGEATLVGAAPPDERWVLVEFTLTPRIADQRNPMQCYDPSELLVVPFVTPDGRRSEEIAARMHEVVRVLEDGSEVEAASLAGPARLRAIFSLPPTLSGRVQFRYYFEDFGDFLLPM